jgi:hypothetical protein
MESSSFDQALAFFTKRNEWPPGPRAGIDPVLTEHPGDGTWVRRTIGVAALRERENPNAD